MEEFQIDTVINGTKSAIAYAQFDRAQAKLNNNGFKIISLSENAELRIKK